MTKKEIVKNINKAFEISDFSEVRTWFAHDFVMDWPGMFSVDKLDDLELFLKKNAPKRVVDVTYSHFLEDGETVFNNGIITVEMHSGLMIKNYFCDIYEFENMKVKKITSYILHDKN
ncbi:MAG: hypothetical protein KBA33_04300 [Cloacibacterium sp.]|nr:hypothetical protein [Cloacibacterium sp.]